MPPSKQVLYTLRISGPNPFEFVAEGNPPVEHFGGTSLAKAYLTVVELGVLEEKAREAGCRLEAVEGPALSRATHLPYREWETPLCEVCPWFDPIETRNPCGVVELPPESVEALQRVSTLHEDALRNCPVR